MILRAIVLTILFLPRSSSFMDDPMICISEFPCTNVEYVNCIDLYDTKHCYITLPSISPAPTGTECNPQQQGGICLGAGHETIDTFNEYPHTVPDNIGHNAYCEDRTDLIVCWYERECSSCREVFWIGISGTQTYSKFLCVGNDEERAAVSFPHLVPFGGFCEAGTGGGPL